MIKPKTFQELFELVHPMDLLECFDFSGKNDKFSGKGITGSHWEIRREYSVKVWKWVTVEEKDGREYYRERMRNTRVYGDVPDEFYSTLVGCIQDFYWWSHKFHHMHSASYQRVVNALQIPMGS